PFPTRRSSDLVKHPPRAGVAGGGVSELQSGCVASLWASHRPISTSQLHPLLGFHFWPINPMVCRGPLTTTWYGNLILELVSRLDAFSGYPFRTWLTSRAPGGTTGIPEVRPSRSSRTRDSFPQVSYARGGEGPNCLTTF